MQRHSVCSLQGGGESVNIKIEPQKVEVSVNSSTMGIDFGSPVVREFVERDP